MSTTDGNPQLVMDQDPRSTATPPVDAAVARFMATYRTSFDDDFAPITGILNALPYGIASWLVLIVLIVLILWLVS